MIVLLSTAGAVEGRKLRVPVMRECEIEPFLSTTIGISSFKAHVGELGLGE
jgi:hypothetical protein